MRPFRFSVMASSAADAGAWVTMARRAEELGYDAFMVPDHVGGQFAPIAALATVAAGTTRIKIGSYVFSNDFRHPLQLAAEAATLDVLSGGRLLLGIGAGWRVADYRSLGLTYDEPRIRIDRLVESVAIIKRLMAGETVTHDGAYYHLDEARLAPLPLQRPRPVLLIGGGGPRMLRFAAREADIVSILPQHDARGRRMVAQATIGAMATKAAILREAAGARFDQLDIDVLVYRAGVVGRREGAVASAKNAAAAGATSLVGTPYAVYGTPSHLRDLLLRRREQLGLNSYTFRARAMELMAPVVAMLEGR